MVLEVKPGYQQKPADLSNLYIRTGMSGATAGLVAGGSSTTGLSQGPVNSSTAAATAATSSAQTSSSGISSANVFPTGGQVPLSAFTHVKTVSVPITVNHQGQFPVITLSFNLAPNASLGDAVDAVNKVKDDLQLPGSIDAEFQGTAQAFQKSLANEWVLILAALVTVYIVLGVLYESYILHPIMILSTLPSAGVGAFTRVERDWLRFQRDLADRHRAADRHREKERHHDDRFRAGGGTA